MINLNSKIMKFLCIFIMLALHGCGKDEKKISTQVAAKVNGAEISLHQINQVLKTTKDVNAQNASAVKKEILDKLIDQQIIVEKSEQDKLDRTADVMMAIEAAKKDILARAYLQKLVTESVKITDADVKKYYDEHPALFSKRRIYSLQDIGMLKNDQLLVPLQAQLDKQKSMQEIAEWLKSQGIKFNAGAYTRPAEQIPLEILPELQALQDGSSSILNIGNSVHVIRIVNSQEAPINLASATPFIRNYFMNTKGKQFVEDEMKKFRAAAKIEYVGDFVAAAGASEGTKHMPAVDTTASSKSDDKKSVLDEGISGLK